MEVQISNLQVMHDVLVVSGLVQSFILGNDILRQHKCDILYSAGVLNFAGGSVPMHIYDAGINFIASVALMEDATNDPHTECVVPGEVWDSAFLLGQDVVIEPLPNSVAAGTDDWTCAHQGLRKLLRFYCPSWGLLQSR